MIETIRDRLLDRTAIIFAGQFAVFLLGALAIGYWYWRHRLEQKKLGRYIDVLLVGSFVGLIVGRLVYIGLEWHYFSTYPEDIQKIWYGGFDWHGIVWGSILGLWLMAMLRKISFADLSDGIALITPVLMMGAWAACRHGGCAYGQSVDHQSTTPEWLIGFLPDTFGDVVIRVELQVFAAILGLLLFWVMVGLTLQNRLQHKRLGLVLALMGISMFMLGFWRGDELSTWQGLHSQQWLDLLMACTGIIIILSRSQVQSTRLKSEKIKGV